MQRWQLLEDRISITESNGCSTAEYRTQNPQNTVMMSAEPLWQLHATIKTNLGSLEIHAYIPTFLQNSKNVYYTYNALQFPGEMTY